MGQKAISDEETTPETSSVDGWGRTQPKPGFLPPHAGWMDCIKQAHFEIK